MKRGLAPLRRCSALAMTWRARPALRWSPAPRRGPTCATWRRAHGRRRSRITSGSSSRGTTREKTCPPVRHAPGRPSRQGPTRFPRALSQTNRGTHQRKTSPVPQGHARLFCTGFPRPNPPRIIPSGSTCSTRPALCPGPLRDARLALHIALVQCHRRQRIPLQIVMVIEILIAQC